MSTTMQCLWADSENYSLYAPINLMSQIDLILVDTLPDIDLAFTQLAKLNPVMSNTEKGLTNVLSSEALSFSFLHHPKLGDYTLLKQKYLANLLGDLSEKVLVIVRDPIAWIYSAHAQLVREGGCTDLCAFIDQYRSVILNNLNLKATVSYWRDAGCDVVVLPMELYKQSTDEFWTAYENKLGVALPDSRDTQLDSIKQNITLYDTLDIHQRLNAVLEFMQGIIESNDMPDRAAHLRAMEIARTWGTRMSLEFCEEQHHGMLRSALGLPDKPVSPTIALDQAFLDYLHTHFIDAIPDDSFFIETGILDGYKASLRCNIQATKLPSEADLSVMHGSLKAAG